MLVTLSGYILILEGCQQSAILAFSKELQEYLKQKGYYLWTPWRHNMNGASKHNDWKLLALRRTIETRFSELCTLFDIEHILARGGELDYS